MNLLKKHFLPIIIFVIIFACFVVEFGAMPANAASCRISFSDPSCIVGNTVTVNVSVTGEIAAADITVVYSTDYLEFVSVSGELSSGGNGSICTTPVQAI